MPRTTLEHVEQAEDPADVSTESFDRVAFAERAVALVKPPRMRVAICEGARKMRVSSGRQWGRPGVTWAMVMIPPNASRKAIASAVLALHEGEHKPFTLDVLMAGALNGPR